MEKYKKINLTDLPAMQVKEIMEQFGISKEDGKYPIKVTMIGNTIISVQIDKDIIEELEKDEPIKKNLEMKF